MYALIEQAQAAVRKHTAFQPQIGMILGSGLGALADQLDNSVKISYGEIPGFYQPHVPGHRGELALGELAGVPVAVLRGRFHFYEGHSMPEVAFPVRLLHALGCTTLVVTNAAGGLHADWQAGEIMRITDQLFMPGLAGHNPLIGPNDDRLGPRFPPMVGAYDRELGAMAQAAANQLGFRLREGVYAMVAGPSFESAAELRALRILGADAVGMSTAPEVIVARHSGMRVLGLSLITNLALPDGPAANHAEVLAAGEEAKPRFAALLQTILARVGRA